MTIGTHKSGHPMNEGRSEEWAESLQKELADTKEELRLTNGLLDAAKRVLGTIPECPVHGPCDPYAVEWIEKAKARAVMPEWRPMSVLTKEVARKHGRWMMRYAAGACDPSLISIPNTRDFERDYNIHVAEGFCSGEQFQCRPVDRELAPIPWSEVGL